MYVCFNKIIEMAKALDINLNKWVRTFYLFEFHQIPLFNRSSGTNVVRGFQYVEKTTQIRAFSIKREGRGQISS